MLSIVLFAFGLIKITRLYSGNEIKKEKTALQKRLNSLMKIENIDLKKKFQSIPEEEKQKTRGILPKLREKYERLGHEAIFPFETEILGFLVEFIKEFESALKK